MIEDITCIGSTQKISKKHETASTRSSIKLFSEMLDLVQSSFFEMNEKEVSLSYAQKSKSRFKKREHL